MKVKESLLALVEKVKRIKEVKQRSGAWIRSRSVKRGTGGKKKSAGGEKRFAVLIESVAGIKGGGEWLYRKKMKERDKKNRSHESVAAVRISPSEKRGKKREP